MSLSCTSTLRCSTSSSTTTLSRRLDTKGYPCGHSPRRSGPPTHKPMRIDGSRSFHTAEASPPPHSSKSSTPCDTCPPSNSGTKLARAAPMALPSPLDHSTTATFMPASTSTFGSPSSATSPLLSGAVESTPGMERRAASEPSFTFVMSLVGSYRDHLRVHPRPLAINSHPSAVAGGVVTVNSSPDPINVTRGPICGVEGADGVGGAALAWPVSPVPPDAHPASTGIASAPIRIHLYPANFRRVEASPRDDRVTKSPPSAARVAPRKQSGRH
ncbi:hypothetical protein SAMN05216410_1843 [Sanguibacter gelidistatuariae]|uniref:Uncharacterized protein n=1 Tax=Sanguibacter gelidistatuariae TaxID=1814289 RepID=A0A1G6LFG2_9MICO|nr:hypothetical protein SAMN05216410_1843 [Sanguibacter gelidistatuariae]